MRGEFVDLQGVRIYYYAAGSRGAGEPVLFLHGFATSGHLWRETVAQMPAGHRMVVADLLGFGRSDAPGDASLSLRAHARRLRQLMDSLGIDRACLVGHGLGGAVAHTLALEERERVTRLALVNGAGVMGWPPRSLRIARGLLPLVRPIPRQWVLPLLRSELQRGYLDRARHAHDVDQYLRPFTQPGGLEALLRHLRAVDLAEARALAHGADHIGIPTAVVLGARDPLFGVRAGRALAASIPHARLTVLPDVGHFAPEEAPRQVAAAVLALLAL